MTTEVIDGEMIKGHHKIRRSYSEKEVLSKKYASDGIACSQRMRLTKSATKNWNSWNLFGKKQRQDLLTDCHCHMMYVRDNSFVEISW